MDDAYVAGLFDGEGYVRVDVWKKPESIHTRYQVKVGLGMTHRPVVEMLHQKFGGNFYANRHDLRNSKNRIQFMWTACSLIAVRFLERIQPHLIVKKEQVELALELQQHIDRYKFKLGNQYQSHPERDRIFAERADLATRIAVLKKESFPSLVDSRPIGSVNGH